MNQPLPPPPPKKSRTPLYVGIAAAVVGGAVLLGVISEDDDETAATTTVARPADDVESPDMGVMMLDLAWNMLTPTEQRDMCRGIDTLGVDAAADVLPGQKAGPRQEEQNGGGQLTVQDQLLDQIADQHAQRRDNRSFLLPTGAAVSPRGRIAAVRTGLLLLLLGDAALAAFGRWICDRRGWLCGRARRHGRSFVRTGGSLFLHHLA
jgi:hypothetical protein